MTGKGLFQCFVFFLLTGLNADVFAQTEQETRNIATLCKVWGFLKYYHPEVAKGKLDWDKEFMIRVKPAAALKSKEETSKFYLEWIESLGEVKECKKCDNNIPDSLKFNLDNEWLRDTNFFSPELAKRLVFIEENRNQGKNKYVSKTRWIRSALITNEIEYKDSLFPVSKLRLLSLARYWNFVNYFFPYKYLMDQKWSDVLNEMVPRFYSAGDIYAYHVALLELVVKLSDTHAHFSTRESFIKVFGLLRTPFSTEWVEDVLIVTQFNNDSLCENNDVLMGDVIVSINDTSIMDLFAAKKKFVYGSNDEVKKYLISHMLLYGNSDSVKVKFERKGNLFEKYIHRYHPQSYKFDWYIQDSVEAYAELGDNIGYINIGKLTKKDLKDIMPLMMAKKGIIIDARAYPGVFGDEISPYLNSNLVPFAKFTVPDITYPGVFRYTKPSVCGVKKNKNYYNGKVVVLFNESTQSAAEFSVMALETAPNVITVGSQTSGADGNVTPFVFPGGFNTIFSGIGVYYPDGRETQRIGIVPDIEVKPTIKGIREGRDEVLEKAIEVINQR